MTLLIWLIWDAIQALHPRPMVVTSHLEGDAAWHLRRARMDSQEELA